MEKFICFGGDHAVMIASTQVKTRTEVLCRKLFGREAVGISGRGKKVMMTQNGKARIRCGKKTLGYI